MSFITKCGISYHGQKRRVIFFIFISSRYLIYHDIIHNNYKSGFLFNSNRLYFVNLQLNICSFGDQPRFFVNGRNNAPLVIRRYRILCQHLTYASVYLRCLYGILEACLPFLNPLLLMLFLDIQTC